MLDYANLRALSIVVSEGGFERAAKVLCITQSAVSQRIKQLEERVGQPLVVRSTPIKATPMGKRLLRHFTQVELLENELRIELDVDDPSIPTIIKIAVNADSLATWFLPALGRMIKRHQWILEVLLDNESYTHNYLQNGEVFGCITTTKQAPPGCSSVYLGDMEYLCVAAFDFMDKYFPDTVSRAALELAPAVKYSTKDEIHEKYMSQYFQMKVGDWSQHRIPSSETLLDCVIHNIGYGLVPHLQAVPLLNNGILVELTPGKRIRVPLYWQHWNIKGKQTSVIYESLAKLAKQSLYQG